MKRTAVIVFGIALGLTGCQKRARVASLPPTLTPVSTSSPAPALTPLETADVAFETGDYAQAARSYEGYLQSSPLSGERDEALFRLGLIYASPDAPGRDWNRASEYMKQLIDQHPDSPLRPSAAVILSLYSEVTQLRTDFQQRDLRIKQLTTELDKLKKIDAERRKKN